MDGEKDLETIDGKYLAGKAKIKLRMPGYPAITPENIKLVRKYVYPGTYWEDNLKEEDIS